MTTNCKPCTFSQYLFCATAVYICWFPKCSFPASYRASSSFCIFPPCSIRVVKLIVGSTCKTAEKQRLEPQSSCSLAHHWLIPFVRAIVELMLVIYGSSYELALRHVKDGKIVIINLVDVLILYKCHLQYGRKKLV